VFTVGKYTLILVWWFALLEQSLRRELARVRKSCFESVVKHRTVKHSVSQICYFN